MTTQFILVTKDRKEYLKIYFRAATVLTNNRDLAMRFRTRSEAKRIGMIISGVEFVTEKF